MTEIPEQVAIQLPDLQRSALRSLLDKAPPDYSLDDLLEVVLAKGIASLVKGRELPDISEEIAEKAKDAIPLGEKSPSARSGFVKDYLGFAILPDQEQALDELATQHPFVHEDALCRIVFSAGLRALPDDDVARRSLTDAVWTEADGGSR